MVFKIVRKPDFFFFSSEKFTLCFRRRLTNVQHKYLQFGGQ